MIIGIDYNNEGLLQRASVECLSMKKGVVEDRGFCSPFELSCEVARFKQHHNIGGISMVVRFTVHAEGLDTYPDTRKSAAPGAQVTTRRVMMLDNSDGPRLSQIVELNLPAEHPELGLASVVWVKIDEIAQIFAGRPRLRGSIVANAKGDPLPAPKTSARA